MSIFPTKILLASDGSKEANLAARTAVDLAAKTGSELHVAFIVRTEDASEYGTIGFNIEKVHEQEIKQMGQRLLDEQVRWVEEAGGTVAGAHFRIARPDQGILAVAEDVGTGLIVLGSRGLGGVKRALMGSVSDSVVRHAHCPVLVVRKEDDLDQQETDQEMLLA
ncbi:MAG: universal stress protein [Actinomycetota bacterium]|nr:universal stress protein [Actinomycetota bacterium]